MDHRHESAIVIDLSRSRLDVNLPDTLELTLRFDSPSRRFYLAVIALVLREMQRRGRITSIPLQDHVALLALLNDTVGDAAGASDSEHLLPRIYRKWKSALPDLEHAPLFKVLRRKKDYAAGGSRTYDFTDMEQDRWASLFAYAGSEEHVRLRFSVDSLGVGLEDVALVYEDAWNESAWERFVSGLTAREELPPRTETIQCVPEAERAALPASPPKNPWLRRHRWVAVVAALAVGIGIAGVVAGMVSWPAWVRTSGNVASPEKGAGRLPEERSIAVLPFTNLSGDPKDTYLADSLAEEIITALARVPHVVVIARTSSFTYKGKAVDLRQVGRELGVRYVLEGSVMREGARLRIAAQLIDATTGQHVFAERYERDTQDIFALLDDVAIRILTAFGKETRRGETAPTRNLNAFLKVLEAREYRQHMNKESQARARELAEDAIALDPRYGTAYAAAAAAIANGVILNAYPEPRAALEHAMSLATQAVALDDSLPSGHFVLGLLHIMLHRDYQRGIGEAERAVAAAPASADAYTHLATFLTWAGRSEDALPLCEKAMRLAPIPPWRLVQTLALVKRDLGQYDEAVAILKRALQRWPDDMVSHLNLASTLELAGQVEAARAEVAEVYRMDPKFSVERFARALPWKDQAQIDGLASSLRRAGLH